MAKWLLQAGQQVTLYEIGSKVGGIWVYRNDSGRSPAYRTLTINSDKRTTQFNDFPFPETAAVFPHHSEMAAYLAAYAEAFGITKHIRFNSRVIDVYPEADGNGQQSWVVIDESGDRRTYDVVVVANGHVSTPRHPAWATEFTGEYLHSFDYSDPADFAHKRVCVVGAGNSGFDVAADVCTIAERTVVAARSGVELLPKFFFGKPLIAIREAMGRWHVPSPISRWVMSTITNMLHGDVKSLGFRKPELLTRPTSNGTIVTHIKFRRVAVKPGVRRVDQRTVEFDDGSAEEFDTLVAATGYHVDVPFIPNDLLPLSDEHVPLYRRIVPSEVKGLYFIGLLQFIGSFFKAFDTQAQWISDLITEKAVLPSREEMRAAIVAKDEFNKTHYLATTRHYLEEDGPNYTRTILKEIKTGRARAQSQLTKRANNSRAASSLSVTGTRI